MQAKPNIDPAIAEAWEEGRRSGIREAADRLERVQQIKEWEGMAHGKLRRVERSFGHREKAFQERRELDPAIVRLGAPCP